MSKYERIFKENSVIELRSFMNITRLIVLYYITDFGILKVCLLFEPNFLRHPFYIIFEPRLVAIKIKHFQFHSLFKVTSLVTIHVHL